MLEAIVKKHVPFTGGYVRDGFEEKGRIAVPKPFVETKKKAKDRRKRCN